MEERKFRCTGMWNGEKFERVIEAEDEGEARDHWLYWACLAGKPRSKPGRSLSGFFIENISLTSTTL